MARLPGNRSIDLPSVLLDQVAQEAGMLHITNTAFVTMAIVEYLRDAQARAYIPFKDRKGGRCRTDGSSHLWAPSGDPVNPVCTQCGIKLSEMRHVS